MNELTWILVGAAAGVAFLGVALFGALPRTGGDATGTRRRRGRSTSRILAQGLVVAALVYVGFAAFGGASGRWWAIELTGVAAYGLLAWLGMRVSPWFLALGWGLHVLWDVIVHGPAETFVPTWYPPACLGFDFAVALVVAGWILSRASASSKTPRMQSRIGTTARTEITS